MSDEGMMRHAVNHPTQENMIVIVTAHPYCEHVIETGIIDRCCCGPCDVLLAAALVNVPAWLAAHPDAEIVAHQYTPAPIEPDNEPRFVLFEEE